MKRGILVALMLAPALTAGQSLTVGSGALTVTLPTAAPWTTMGSPSQPSRWEFRLHSIGPLANGYMVGLPAMWVTGSPTPGIPTSLSNSTTHNPPVGDSYATTMGPFSLGTAGDYLVRVQRDVANNRSTMEVCATLTGQCIYSPYSPQHITAYGQTSWAGWQFTLNPGYSIDFLRWFSTAVPIGTPIPIRGVTGDLADWEFDGSAIDSVRGLKFSGGSLSYQPTPAYPPSCNAGVQQSFRAGFPGRLDGSGSKPLDGGTSLTYLWQQVPNISPVDVLWNNSQRLSQPTVDGLVAGSYNFRLTVTDGSGQSTNCVVHDGAVATDDNGVVSVNNPAVDQLLGKMIQLGRNPWPWMDDRNKYIADVQTGNIDNYYLDYWNTPAAGTVSVTAGSTLVTGLGTHFTTDICGKGGDPAVPQDNLAMFVWWNGGNNRRVIQIASCTDDTHLIAQSGYSWNPPPGYPQNESGVSYSLDKTYSLIWQYGGNAQYPANYYDNVAAFYALYYRSGIDTYLTYARKLADRFWVSPMIDQGASMVINHGSQWGYSGRSWSSIGLVLRALDGRPDMWNGLHKLWDFDLFFLVYPNTYGVYSVGDERETGYRAFRLGLCALYDTDPLYRDRCKSGIKTMVANVWKPVHDYNGGGYFPGFANNPYTSFGNGMDVYAVATNGSSTITLASAKGTRFDPKYFPGAVWMWPCVNPGPIDGCGKPLGNFGGDPAFYYVSYQDATHASLTDVSGAPVAYTGATGTKGLTLNGPWTGPGATYVALGYGTQPFMQGIIASGLDIDAQAMFDGAYDIATGALLNQYVSEQLNWLASYALEPASKGMYYFVGHKDCPVGAIALPMCGIPDPANPGAARILNAEAVRGAMFSWDHAGRPQAVRDFIDLMVNAMFAKPGTCPTGSTLCVPDGHYIDSYENNGVFACCKPPGSANPKWFGMSWGLNPSASWPAMRLGGALPPKNRRARIGFNLEGVPGATHVNVLATSPSGQVARTSCSTSPCEMDLDVSQGGNLLRLQYLSASGVVLATQEVATESVH